VLLWLTMSTLSQPLARLTRRRDASSSLVLLIVSAGFSLAVLDVFIVNVALPNIARDFGSAGLGDLSWVLNAYAIVYAALLVVFGRLADRFPREYGFLLGVAVFTVASALCAAANDTLGLVVFRVVQAAGAALMTPTSLSMVLATSSGEERDNNVRAWTAIGGLMAALGPVVGGLLVAISWRWVFFANIPFGLARGVTESSISGGGVARRWSRPQPVDAQGPVVGTGALARRPAGDLAPRRTLRTGLEAGGVPVTE
jgi:MFS family permease